MDQLGKKINQHYGSGAILQKIEAGLQLAGKDLNKLTVDDLAPVDEFHTRGRIATLELAALAKLSSTDRVLDVGCGLGGTARHLAEQHKCEISGIDLTEEYISVGKRLTELVGLSEFIDLRCASALELPFEDQSFDVVWTEHVQMNIADKEGFYGEISRVLKPGGHLLFHDVFRGNGESPLYPTPWAENESLSALATESQIHSTLDAVGLEINQWLVKVEESIEFFKKALERVKAEGPPPLGIHLLMGENAKEKLQNYVQGLSENRVTVVMGMATKVKA